MHETACGLQDPNHRIASRFVEVMELAAGDDGVVAACGCGSCFHTDADLAYFWVAQNDMVETAHVNHHGETAVERLEQAADELGVPVSVPPSDSYTLVLGVSNYYANLEPGDRVTDGSVEGTVMDPKTVNPEMDWVVYDQSDYDGFGAGGPVLGEFPNREAANTYAEFHDFETYVTSLTKYATRPGENIVLWDGHVKPAEVKTSDVEFVEDN